MAKIWFVTGTSKGFGREWATAALNRGDKVVATARDVTSLDNLVARFGDDVLALALDVNDRDACFAAVAAGLEAFGRLDVVVNNAGYGQFGMTEEVSEAEARAQFDTCYFGALWVTQAALPILRSQGSGHLLQVSSVGGVSAFPGIGQYNAAKWALEAMSQSLSAEVSGFGIKVTLIEPGGFDTDWAGPSAKHAEALGAYDELRAAMTARRASMVGQRGDPRATSAVVLELVDLDEPPLRLFLGTSGLAMAEADFASRLAEWRRFDQLSRAAQG